MGNAIIVGGRPTSTDLLGTDTVNALAGTAGSPSASNKFVTNADTRNSDARTPTAHGTAQHSGAIGSDTQVSPSASETITPAAHVYTPNFAYNFHTMTLDDATGCQLANPTGAVVNQTGVIQVNQPVAGGDLLAFDTYYTAASGVIVAPPTGASAKTAYFYWVQAVGAGGIVLTPVAGF